MSKTETPPTETADRTPPKGCGCGHRTPAKGHAPAAHPAPPPTESLPGHAAHPDHEAGCCGGRKGRH